MPDDPHRSTKDAFHYQVAFRALAREDEVLAYYKFRGYRILSENDDQTRSVFGIPKTSKSADIVVQTSARQAIIAEVKGTNIDHAIAQLQSTVAFVRPKFAHISTKIFTSAAVPSGDTVTFHGGPYARGYLATRVFRAAFPGEWPLMAITIDGSTEVIRVGDEPVCVIFGPY